MKRAHAFTLIEVMVAAVLFFIVFSAASQTFSATRIAYARQRDLMTAENVLQRQMERLLVLAPSHRDLAEGHHVGRASDVEGRVVDGSDGVFTVAWDIAANTPLTAMRRIVATAAWRESTGELHTLTFTTDRD